MAEGAVTGATATTMAPDGSFAGGDLRATVVEAVEPGARAMTTSGRLSGAGPAPWTSAPAAAPRTKVQTPAVSSRGQFTPSGFLRPRPVIDPSQTRHEETARARHGPARRAYLIR
jgi:hypothetical protein